MATRSKVNTTPRPAKKKKPVEAVYDANQSVPTLVVRGRDVELVVLDHPVEWDDLVGRGNQAVCDAGYEVVLYRDRADALILLTRGGQKERLRRNVNGGHRP